MAKLSNCAKDLFFPCRGKDMDFEKEDAKTLELAADLLGNADEETIDNLIESLEMGDFCEKINESICVIGQLEDDECEFRKFSNDEQVVLRRAFEIVAGVIESGNYDEAMDIFYPNEGDAEREEELLNKFVK